MKKNYLKGFILLLVLCVFTSVTYAQTGSISGLVLDENSQPLPGASVLVKSLNRATSTDENGEFRISGLSSGSYVVSANYIGYLTSEQSVSLKQTAEIKFILQPSSQALNEVVVIGYGTQKKSDLTGSISTVTAKDFQKGTISTPEQLIVGKVPGVQITSNSGAPGAGSTIRIRGGASLNASNEPLIVVDGIPLAPSRKTDNSSTIPNSPDPLSLINPNDIESFTVLKDASSTAIYGSRASNGVILITTKKGASGEAKISFNTQNSIATLGKQLDVLSADQIREYVNANGTDVQKAWLGGANTNWQDQIFRNSFTTDNNLSVAGAFKKVPYRISFGHLDQSGTLIEDKFQRTSYALNLSPKIFDDHLKIDLNFKGSLSENRFANTGAINAATQFDPTQPIRSNSTFGGYFEFPQVNSDGTVSPNPNAPRNPVALIEQQINRGNAARSFGNLQLDYSFHFLPELHANLNLGYDVAEGRGRIQVPAVAAQNFADRGKNDRSDQTQSNKVVEFYLNYNKDVKSIKSNINATAGYGFYDNLSTVYNFPRYSESNGIIAGSEPAFAFDKPQNRLLSYYGRLIYTLNNKYILSGSIRTDGSSRFSKDVRWGVFPGAAFTWRMNEESFLKNVNAVSDLKLRLSYGITGQQEGIANYSYLPNYSISGNDSQYQFGDSYYSMFRPVAYDSNLQWETTETYNAGIDYGFANNRINGSVDIYRKKTKDLLATVNIPAGSNFSNQLLTNVGNMTNEGVEFNINLIPVATTNTNWTLGFNATYNDNEVTNLTLVPDPNYQGLTVGGIAGGTGQTIQVHSVGYTPFSYLVQKQVYDQNGRPLEGVYVDLNGDGIVTPADVYRYKSPTPKMILGFSTQFSYKQWSMSTVLRSNLGNYVYNNIASNYGVQRNILNPSGYVANSTTDIYNTNFSNNQFLSDYYVQNGSFLRMENLTLGYNAGRVLGISNLRLNATCQNVFVVTKYKGLDPELRDGIDNSFYPRPRTFVLGLNLDF